MPRPLPVRTPSGADPFRRGPLPVRTPSGADSDDPAHGGTWGPERPVRASVLRSLLLDGPRKDGRVAALSLTGARVSGRLGLQLPVISFGQENASTPEGGWQTLSYVLIATGWILATTVIAGLTRTVSRR